MVPSLGVAVNKLAESMDENKLKSLENRKKTGIDSMIEKITDRFSGDSDFVNACNL